MSRKQLASAALIAAVALATGFVLAGQVRTQLLTPSNQVAQREALVRSVQDLEATNSDSRRRISALRASIDALEALAGQRSATTQDLRNQVANLRAHAGLTPIHGPGVEVDVANGVPAPSVTNQNGYLVSYQDVQDLVNLLFAQGAEGISVNGRRITPLSAFSGSEGQVVIDQGPPLTSPLKLIAVGDRNQMETALADPSVLPDIRARQVEFQLNVTFAGSPDVSLPAYDSSLQSPYVTAG